MLLACSRPRAISIWKRKPTWMHKTGWSSYETQHVWTNTRKRSHSQAQVELRAYIRASKEVGISVHHRDLQATTEVVDTVAQTPKHLVRVHIRYPNDATGHLRLSATDVLRRSITPELKDMALTVTSATLSDPPRRSVRSVPCRFPTPTVDQRLALRSSTRLRLPQTSILYTAQCHNAQWLVNEIRPSSQLISHHLMPPHQNKLYLKIRSVFSTTTGFCCYGRNMAFANGRRCGWSCALEPLRCTRMRMNTDLFSSYPSRASLTPSKSTQSAEAKSTVCKS